MVIELTSEQKSDTPAEMVDLFSIDGKTYQIPAKPRANVVLRYLHDIQHSNEDLAAARLLESLLGAEGFNALMDYDDLELEQFQAVLQAAQEVVMGAIEAASGND